MYTYNLYCFGHQLSSNKELNNLLNELDINFSKKINNRLWEINFPYHGGQVKGDCRSCVFGTIITDDDMNPDYISEIRNLNEYNFVEDYKEFLSMLVSDLESDSELCDLFSKLKDFLDKNNPLFYSVQVSS